MPIFLFYARSELTGGCISVEMAGARGGKPYLFVLLIACFAAKHTLFTIFLHYKATLDICV